MTRIEERFARDIAVVTGGVVVTESNLREARESLDDRIQGPRPRARRRAPAVAAAAAVALAAGGVTVLLTLGGGDDEATQLAGPGAEPTDPDASFLIGNPPTAQLVGGVWRLDNGEIIMKFDKDGTVRFDGRGTLFSAPVTTGTYAIAGDLITVTTVDDDRAECIGTEFAMRAALPEAGALRYVGSGPSRVCAPLPPGQGVLEQALPTSRSMAELVFSKDVGWKPLTDKALLHGVWLAEGGGHVLELDADGAYYIADGSAEPVDRGQWSLVDARLTLNSSAGSTTCSEGARLVLGSVEWIDPGTRAFRGTVSDNACGAPWTPATWILFPNTVG